MCVTSESLWAFSKEYPKERPVLMIKYFLQHNQTLMKVMINSTNIQRLREQLMKKKCQNGINFVNESMALGKDVLNCFVVVDRKESTKVSVIHPLMKNWIKAFNQKVMKVKT
jgi:hypothetical protein